MPAEARTRPTRRYRSRLRDQQAEQTKRAVIDAAHDLFLAKGWVGTTMREVADRAEVALETVYSHFSSKKGLLRAVIDEVAVGDDAPVPLAQRPEFAALGEGSRSKRLTAAAVLARTLNERTATIAELLREAAPTDDEIAQMLHETRERQRVDVGRALDLILGRPPTTQERDGTWAIVSPEVWFLLVQESGWNPAQYEEWIAATLERVLPRR